MGGNFLCTKKQPGGRAFDCPQINIMKGKYQMEIASDAPGNRKLIEVKKCKIRSGQRIKEELMSGGGFVARISVSGKQ